MGLGRQCTSTAATGQMFRGRCSAKCGWAASTAGKAAGDGAEGRQPGGALSACRSCSMPAIGAATARAASSSWGACGSGSRRASMHVHRHIPCCHIPCAGQPPAERPDETLSWQCVRTLFLKQVLSAHRGRWHEAADLRIAGRQRRHTRRHVGTACPIRAGGSRARRAAPHQRRRQLRLRLPVRPLRGLRRRRRRRRPCGGGCGRRHRHTGGRTGRAAATGAVLGLDISTHIGSTSEAAVSIHKALRQARSA